jgi:hypothetical protein
MDERITKTDVFNRMKKWIDSYWDQETALPLEDIDCDDALDEALDIFAYIASYLAQDLPTTKVG